MKNKSGFTLIEMIITLALTVIILLIISSMFITGNKVFSDSDVKSTLQIEGQAIQENISKIGMESIGIESIEDEFGKDFISTEDGDVKLVKSSYEQLNSRLTDSDGTNKENKWIAISELRIKPYIEDSNGNISIGTSIPMIQYEKDKRKLSIAGKELSSHVESVRIKPIDIVENMDGNFEDTNSILINIELIEQKGYSNVRYPISIEVKFRNNFIK